MPIYEYGCKACGHTLEVLQKLSDKPLRKCPECGRAKLARLVSAPAFRLKGGGWYETDFKSDKESKRNLADREGKGAAKGADESKAPASAGDGKTKTEAASGAEKTGAGKSAAKPAKSTTKAAGKGTGSEAA